MLRALRNVLKPGGVLGFFVIAIRGGLSAADRRSAEDVGPPQAASERDYPSMLESCGFTQVHTTDVTADYATTTAAWRAAWSSRATEIAALVGVEEFEDRQERRRLAEEGAVRGLLERQLILAR